MAPSQLPRNILFPTDFSKSSEAIISHVVGLASAFNAKVWLLSVVPSLADLHGVSENCFGQLGDAALANLDRDRKLLETDCLRKLECLQKRYFQSVESEICIRSEGVAESIVDYAVEKKADLIMMPTHGLGRMRRFLIGSVTAKVLHDAVCPVWTSPHPRELEPFHPYRHILLAIDNRELPVELLTRAAELAEFFHGQLSVLRALPAHGTPGDEAVLKRTREMADALHDRIAAKGVKASVHLMEGNPGEVVRQVAEEIEDADLIITGRGHLDESMGHLRTHAYEIIWNAPCPVITM
ncbi:MAG: universal stress protein [Acidobacteriia bacterium]|nr:universal stress protein [Terriglobia bacterium]